MFKNKNINEKFYKRVYRVLTVILLFYWVIFAFCGVARCGAMSYVYPLKYKEQVFKYSDENGLESALVFAVIKTESSFDEKATSNAGAIGLMQITPSTGEYIAKKLGVENYDLYDIETNLKFGCYYIKYLFTRFENMDTAMIAYNAGEGNVALWLNNPSYSSDKKTLVYVPFLETREYIKKIQENFSKYKKLYGKFLDKRNNFE